jgi:tRNA-specific 2-thiouridylase
MRQRVAVALSGGADSAVAALILKQSPCEVLAMHLLLTDTPASLAQLEQAQALSRHLGIEMHIVDLVQEFASLVMAPFCSEYAAGRTPNPCVVCNRSIKFGVMLREALLRGADRLATGHYARVERHTGRSILLRALDKRADQSYFLYAVDGAAFERLLLPLGTMTRKRVHSIACDEGLPTGSSSKDLCFINDRSYHRFMASRVSSTAGDIVDTGGRVLGQHRGLPFYTVGQRRGLGVALAKPQYVIRLDARLNLLVVGTEDELYSEAATLRSLSWLAGKPPDSTLAVHAKARFRSRGIPAHVTFASGEAYVRFSEPQRAIAPGQSIVFYDGDTVLGGGVIYEAHREAKSAC